MCGGEGGRRASGERRGRRQRARRETGRRAAATCTRRRGEGRQEQSKQARHGHTTEEGRRGEPGNPTVFAGAKPKAARKGREAAHATEAPVFPQKQTGLGGRAKALASDAPVFCDRSTREPAAFFGWVMSATVWAITDPCRKSSQGGMKAAEITSYHSPRNRIRSSRSRPGGGAEIAIVLCAR